MAFVSSVQTIRDEIAFRLNEAELDNTDFYTNQINLALADIRNSLPTAPFLQVSADRTLSAGTRIYPALISDFQKMNSVTDPAGDLKLSYLSPEEYDVLQPSATEGGRPTIYTIRGQGVSSRFEFYPQPGGSYTLHFDYNRNLPTVSAGSATPELPVNYYELLVLYGEARGLRRRGLRADAQSVMNEYEEMKQKMIQDLMNQTNENQRIKSVREFQSSRSVYDDPIKNMFWNN